MFKNMALSTKLISLFLLVGILPAAILGTIMLTNATEDMQDQKKVTFSTLTAVRDVKKAQIEKYFDERESDLGVLVDNVAVLQQEAINKLAALRDVKKNQLQDLFAERERNIAVLAEAPFVLQAYKEINAAFTAGGGNASKSFSGQGEGRYSAPEEYKKVHDQHFALLENYMQQYGYYDLFLMSADNGTICFTVTKEPDFGQITQNVESPLRDVWQLASSEGRVALSDMKPYAPSAGAPAQFIAAPIIENGTTVGVLALQISNDHINRVVGERSGMGETGETYLVGMDNLMRSDSYLDPEHHSVVNSFKDPANGKVATDAASQALAGKTGAEIIIDYNGNLVLSAYTPVEIGDTTWGLLSEIDVAEAFAPSFEGERRVENAAWQNDFYSAYIEKYGYYDLFLIDPTGYVFYSVTHEADYQTNMVNGKYSSSNLGKLVRKVMNTKSYGVVDFAPYAPSNGDPAGFIAQPIVYNNKVEMIIALQLPLDAINSIMGLRTGMGETGESYLVGQDKLMRSDSYLDQENHTVLASFRNPPKGSVDTEASRQALSGKTDAQIIIDYNGNPVLSSYAPIKVSEDTTWAILAEVDEAEAYAGLHSLQTIVGIMSVTALAGIITISLVFARSITKPLNRIIQGMSIGSDQVAAASGQVSSASQQLAEGATEQAAS
ncbi:MAG: cache domain-containing protein, partial [Planctomycetes bacterium]|nr:cache domain-containing protein [Planctomycetota bacterium]